MLFYEDDKELFSASKQGIQSGDDSGEIRDRRDGGRNMPGLGREHGRSDGGNLAEGNHDANGSDQADSPKSGPRDA